MHTVGTLVTSSLAALLVITQNLEINGNNGNINEILYLAQSVLDPTAIYLGGVNQKRGNNRGENV